MRRVPGCVLHQGEIAPCLLPPPLGEVAERKRGRRGSDGFAAQLDVGPSQSASLTAPPAGEPRGSDGTVSLARRGPHPSASLTPSPAAGEGFLRRQPLRIRPGASRVRVHAAGRGKPLPYDIIGSAFVYVGAGLAPPVPTVSSVFAPVRQSVPAFLQNRTFRIDKCAVLWYNPSIL